MCMWVYGLVGVIYVFFFRGLGLGIWDGSEFVFVGFWWFNIEVIIFFKY